MAPITFTQRMLICIKGLSSDCEYRNDVIKLVSEISKCKEYEINIQVKELFILFVRLFLKMTSALNRNTGKLHTLKDEEAYDVYKNIYYNIVELGNQLTTVHDYSRITWKKEVKKMMGDKQFFINHNKYECNIIERNCEIGNLLVDYYENNCYQDIFYHNNYYHSDCYQNNCYQNETFAQKYAQLLIININILTVDIQPRYGIIIES